MAILKKNQNKTITAILMIIIVISILIFISYTMKVTLEETEVLISQDKITFTGMYGESYPLSAIKNVQLVDEAPHLVRKINGAGFSSQKVYKGHYEVEELGQCRVFLFGDEGPYIMCETGETVLIMYADSQKTLDLYEQLVLNTKMLG